MTDQQYDQLWQACANRGSGEDWYRLGCWLTDNRQWVSASVAFARSLMVEPGNYRAVTNYGWTLHLSGRPELAEEWLTRAHELAPDESQPLALRAQVRLVLGKDEEAVKDAKNAVGRDYNDALTRLSAGFAFLNAGQYVRGWQELEGRFAYKLKDFLSRPYRLWRGERCKHLLIEAEQGAGDAIFAWRWVGQASVVADHVSIYVHSELYALLAEMGNLPENAKLYPMPRPLHEGDAWCPMMSLPAALESPSARKTGAYIGLPKTHASDTPQKARNIGICWAGNPTHEQGHHRDIPLAYLMRLGEIPGIELHSLQVGEGARQVDDLAAKAVLRDRRPEITNFLDTARIMQGLDLVVTVDTAIGHLAGSLGVPCWLILNQKGRDYRWGSKGHASRWYASQRIYRRDLDEDWGPVVDWVGEELRRLT